MAALNLSRLKRSRASIVTLVVALSVFVACASNSGRSHRSADQQPPTEAVTPSSPGWTGFLTGGVQSGPSKTPGEGSLPGGTGLPPVGPGSSPDGPGFTPGGSPEGSAQPTFRQICRFSSIAQSPRSTGMTPPFAVSATATAGAAVAFAARGACQMKTARTVPS